MFLDQRANLVLLDSGIIEWQSPEIGFENKKRAYSPKEMSPLN